PAPGRIACALSLRWRQPGVTIQRGVHRGSGEPAEPSSHGVEAAFERVEKVSDGAPVERLQRRPGQALSFSRGGVAAIGSYEKIVVVAKALPVGASPPQCADPLPGSGIVSQ